MNSLNNDLDNEFDLDDMDFDLTDEVNETPSPGPGSAKKAKSLSFLNDIPVHVTVEVGAKTVTLQELLEVKNDSVLMLTKENGAALDIKVNGKLFAYGEVVVSNGHYGVKITDIVNKDIN
ncbi:MAG: flagellar motor switch protein FliN/FliY [Psychromonas sp.]|jgi:flagellar motor switch protein FliN/FliY|uniref:FliM/FliN family flagellar motor switch protein n=1 Tax=Psychromonas sp. TaxID=1884585 RepID=UPI0039E28B48